MTIMTIHPSYFNQVQSSCSKSVVLYGFEEELISLFSMFNDPNHIGFKQLPH